MNFFSIKDPSHKVSFADALKNGLAPNQSLYFPENIPVFDNTFFKTMHQFELPQLASKILLPYVSPDLTAQQLDTITAEVFNFDIPVVKINDNIFTLELFHGPTLAFKDIGARFLANCIQKLYHNQKIRVLVATSGDTGSAVANGFLGIDGTEVVVLYPKGKVSELQQKQFASLGQNITPIAIEGTFDDCQSLVKSAFIDNTINNEMNLTSANSINVARWIPQSVYYYWAVAQLSNIKNDIVITVPSGNLGNLTSGLLAVKTGLPVKHFIASSNDNRIIPAFLNTGVYQPKPSVQTLANAMDVGDPNNFPRLMQLFNNNISQIQNYISGYAYSDNQISQTIKHCYTNNNYLLDPHGATGYEATKTYLTDKNAVGVFLETAHPGKFVENVEKIIGKPIELPQKLNEFAKRQINSKTMSKNYSEFKQFLCDTK